MDNDQNNQSTLPPTPTEPANPAPSGGQVMDIQSPRPTAFSPVPAPEDTTQNEVNQSQEVPTFVSEPTNSNSLDIEPESTDTTPVAPVSATDTQEQIGNPQTTPPASHPKKKLPIVAIFIALILAVALAGAAVYMYLQKNKSDQARVPKTSTQTIADKPQASASDVDEINKAIEKDIDTLDETKDFSSSELSDTTLGL